MISTTLKSQLQVQTPSLQQAARLGRTVGHALAGSTRRGLGLGLGLPAARRGQNLVVVVDAVPGPRLFSTTQSRRLRDIFPAKDTPHIQTTKPAWPHHGYTMEEMLAVEPVHRRPRCVSDWAAWKVVRFARYCMDKVTGMGRDQQVDKTHPTTSVVAEKPLTEAQWLVRFVFLESIAGVPGMVGGMLRHLSSLRRMKRDNGWIETLLEESYNERMHLLTFMKMCEPGWFMKLLIIGAQGVFFNALFAAYLIHPRIVHRFVGYLEEEAVHTYTRAIREIEHGHLPKWTDPKFEIPDIAVG
ncbi:Alternative oxidase, mitochondrial precursor, partial [Claviceps citrina]